MLFHKEKYIKILFFIFCSILLNACAHTGTIFSSDDYDSIFRSEIPEKFDYKLTNRMAISSLDLDSSQLSKDRKIEFELLRIIQTASNEKEISMLLDACWGSNELIRNFCLKFKDIDINIQPEYIGPICYLAYLSDGSNAINPVPIINKLKSINLKKCKGYAFHFYFYSKINRGDWTDLDAFLHHLYFLTDREPFMNDLDYIKDKAVKFNNNDIIPRLSKFYWKVNWGEIFDLILHDRYKEAREQMEEFERRFPGIEQIEEFQEMKNDILNELRQ
jgi:hypothetical protein